MVADWRRCRFDSLCDITRGASPRPIHDYLGKVGMPWIKIADATNSRSRFIEKTNECIKPNGVSASVRVHPGDLILSNSATPGMPRFVSIEACIHDGWMLLRNLRGLNKNFAYWLLLHERDRLVAQGNGSVFTNLKTDILKSHVVSIPSENEQADIAAVFDALEDKIDLNRRMNETLEAMAQEIFKDWFVDFGPTRAKMEGRAPYIGPEIWALFPDRLDDEGKPEGWKVESVYDQAVWVNGAAYKDMHFSIEPDALPVVKIAELKSDITKTTRFTNTDLGERYKIRNGELLFSWSGNPDTSIDTFVWTSGDAWLNQHIFAVRSNGKRSQTFLYAMLKLLRSEFAEIARNKQTTGLGHVTQQDLIRLKITVPNEIVQDAFDKLVGPLHSQFTNNLFQNQALIATRDFLLPKLLSGEIRIAEAEDRIKEAV